MPRAGAHRVLPTPTSESPTLPGKVSGMGLRTTLLHRPLAQHPPRCVAPARPLTLSEHPLPHPKETCLQGPSPAGRRQADTTPGRGLTTGSQGPRPHPEGDRAGVCGGSRQGRRARDPLLLPFTQSPQGPLGGSEPGRCARGCTAQHGRVWTRRWAGGGLPHSTSSS